MTIERFAPNARMSASVVSAGVVYVSGQVPDDRGQDATGQTRQVLAKIERLLEQAGSDKSKILSAQIWLKDISADFAALNDVWTKWLPADSAPARATVQANLASPDVLVEVMVTAAR